ncbi:MAG TPA: hypothetical protein VFU71_02775 [Burkholderiaceae bacterium]|nr:hypothetical protein [Burkholderiaceae bacterium]
MVTERKFPLVVLFALSCAGGIAHAQADAAKAVDDCEVAVTESVKRMRGKDAQDIQYIKSKRTVTPSTEDETSLKGEGRYRGPGARIVPFSYSCALNTKTGATSGVVFRELAAVSEEKPFVPDLSNVSVSDCEGAAAASLKSKHPRATRIVLDSESRQLRPAQDERIALEGRGAFERAPGMNAAPFTYRCEVEPRSGRIVSVQTSL